MRPSSSARTGTTLKWFVTDHDIRSTEYKDGLDAYLTKTAGKNLPDTARHLKRRIEKAAA